MTRASAVGGRKNSTCIVRTMRTSATSIRTWRPMMLLNRPAVLPRGSLPTFRPATSRQFHQSPAQMAQPSPVLQWKNHRRADAATGATTTGEVASRADRSGNTTSAGRRGGKLRPCQLTCCLCLQLAPTMSNQGIAVRPPTSADAMPSTKSSSAER